MKSILYAAASLAFLAAPALAQSTDTTTSAPATDAAAPPHAHNHHMHRKAQTDGDSPDHYSGVDTAGVREDVKAPYGGNNQTQADGKEAPVTDHLNQMQLQGDSTPPHN